MMLPCLAIGVWVLYLALIAPPCYQAWRSNRISAELVHLLLLAGPSDLPPPTIAEMQADEGG